MRLTLVACVALVALAFAGCSEDPKRYPDGVPETTTTSQSGTETATGSSTGTTSSTTTTGSEGNQPPVASMAVAVNGTKAAFTLNGTDPDGDALVWDLDFGDGNATNGTTLPASVEHAYNATGNLTATFTVTDGTARTSRNVTVTLAGAGVQSQDIDASWEPATNPACADTTAPYDAVPGSFAEFPVEAGTWGKPFTATFDSGAAQDHVLFLDAAGAALLHVTTGLPSDIDWVADGAVPANAAAVVFFGCAGLPGEHVVYHAG